VAKANDSEEGEQVAFTLESVTIGEDTTAPVVSPVEGAQLGQPGDHKLTKNQQTMFSVLHEAGSGGLTTDLWYDRARQAGIGTSRKADLYDISRQLKSKRVVNQYGERWTTAA
jgi:hypothetical protein